jgi:hypothetical protein
MTWVNKFLKFVPLTGISMELVRFDTQQMENPEISGIEYQQGTLAGYEVREYLLNKWNRKCCYCDTGDVPLRIERIEAKTNGGTNRISNLGLAREPCDKKKGTLDIRVFLKNNPESLAKIFKQAKQSLKMRQQSTVPVGPCSNPSRVLVCRLKPVPVAEPSSIAPPRDYQKNIGSMLPASEFQALMLSYLII